MPQVHFSWIASQNLSVCICIAYKELYEIHQWTLVTEIILFYLIIILFSVSVSYLKQSSSNSNKMKAH